MDTAPGPVPVCRAFKIYPSSQLSRPTAGTCRCGNTATSTTTELHLWPLQLHNRDVNHQMYGNWGNPNDQQKVWTMGEASAPRQGSQRAEPL